jgi:uncharacterized protein YdaU (DUF1376 family)
MMHYYQFNIGDYASHTRHLNLLEDLAYRRLLDAYYLQERPLSSGLTSVARQINMRDHEVEVKAVLEEFFELTDEGWVSSRADREIEHFRAKREQASRAGKASAERRSNVRSTDVQPTNNHKPITNNQIKDISSADADFEKFWKAWPSSPRKVAKAKCLEIWKRRKLFAVAEQIVSQVSVLKTTEQWLKGYEPAPLTYLNQSRWEDGLPVGGSGVASSAMPDWASKRATSA